MMLARCKAIQASSLSGSFSISWKRPFFVAQMRFTVKRIIWFAEFQMGDIMLKS